MKRTLVVSLAACMTLAVSGCGSDSKAGSDPDGPVTLEVWDYGVPDDAVSKKIDKAYMDKNPNVTIKRVHQAATSYFPPGPLIRATVAKGEGPDLMATYASPFAFDYQQGIKPLNDLVGKEELDSLVGWDAATRANGDKLVYPLDANGVIFYFDKAKFKKAGLDPEAPPATFDELLTACDKLNSAGIVPINAGWKDGGLFLWWLTLFGTQFQTDEELAKGASDPNWESPAIEKTVDLIREARDRKCFTPDAEGIPLFPDTINNFKAGKGAMSVGLVAADAHWTQYRDTDWGKDGLGVFLAPLVPDSLWSEPRINYGVSSGYWVTKWSPNPEAAVDFMRYMTSPDVQEQLYAEAGMAPANTTAKPAIEDPVGAQIADWASNADPYMDQFTLIGANVLGLMNKYAPSMVKGDTDYDDVVDELVAAHEKSPK